MTMPRKDQVVRDAIDATTPVADPDSMAYNATDGGVPVENMDWKPPETLQTPPAPPGYKLTWVRTSIAGVDDGDNIRAMLSQGWQPVLSTEVPAGYFPPTIRDSRFSNGRAVIGVRDMILMKIPIKMKRQRDAYYAGVANNQIEQIDKRLMAERQRAGDSFSVDRRSTTELRSAPIEAEDDET